MQKVHAPGIVPLSVRLALACTLGLASSAWAADAVVAIAQTPGKLTAMNERNQLIGGPGAAAAFAQVGNMLDPAQQAGMGRGHANDLTAANNPNTDMIGPAGKKVPVIPEMDVVAAIGKARKDALGGGANLTDVQVGRRLLYKRIALDDKVAATPAPGSMGTAEFAFVTGNPFDAQAHGIFGLERNAAGRMVKARAAGDSKITRKAPGNVPGAFASAVANDPITFALDSGFSETFTFTLGDAAEGTFFEVAAYEPGSFATGWVQLDSTIPGNEQLLTFFVSVVGPAASMDDVDITVSTINSSAFGGATAGDYEDFLRDNLVFNGGSVGLNMTMNPLGELTLLNLTVPANTPEFNLTMNVGGFVGKIPEPSSLLALAVVSGMMLRVRRNALS